MVRTVLARRRNILVNLDGDCWLIPSSGDASWSCPRKGSLQTYLRNATASFHDGDCGRSMLAIGLKHRIISGVLRHCGCMGRFGVRCLCVFWESELFWFASGTWTTEAEEQTRMRRLPKVEDDGESGLGRELRHDLQRRCSSRLIGIMHTILYLPHTASRGWRPGMGCSCRR